jgi:hypothetical protein
MPLGASYRRTSQAHEGTHDFDVHAYGRFAAKHAREYGHALLGEGVHLMAQTATSFRND